TNTAYAEVTFLSGTVFDAALMTVPRSWPPSMTLRVVSFLADSKKVP
ncbi:MAG: hypothetical protein GWN73_32805, partial [Actinobacteria bacterium]|nr:hypothetical protein [Actinomycetota bacterium]NIS35190.1 hypothetical protein [Actinomycetota bacterium]NIU69905.1 hypothetical protein [Actinomycetota bacterium]NIW31783.1 hypothetical protein [Actinomycetota bacterium]